MLDLAIRQEGDAPVTVLFDRSLYSAKLFVQCKLAIEQYDRDSMTRTIEDAVEDVYTSPVDVVYIRCSPEVALERCINRRRKEESTTTLDFLQLLHNAHESAAACRFEPMNVRAVYTIDGNQSQEKVKADFIDQVLGDL